MFSVKYKGRVLKQLARLDESIRKHFTFFFSTLPFDPFQGKLSETTYHAHVKYKWVAVWEVDKESEIITVIYAGSREDAPY